MLTPALNFTFVLFLFLFFIHRFYALVHVMCFCSFALLAPFSLGPSLAFSRLSLCIKNLVFLTSLYNSFIHHKLDLTFSLSHFISYRRTNSTQTYQNTTLTKNQPSNHANFRENPHRENHHPRSRAIRHHRERQVQNPGQRRNPSRSATIDLRW